MWTFRQVSYSWSLSSWSAALLFDRRRIRRTDRIGGVASRSSSPGRTNGCILGRLAICPHGHYVLQISHEESTKWNFRIQMICERKKYILGPRHLLSSHVRFYLSDSSPLKPLSNHHSWLLTTIKPSYLHCWVPTIAAGISRDQHPAIWGAKCVYARN